MNYPPPQAPRSPGASGATFNQPTNKGKTAAKVVASVLGAVLLATVSFSLGMAEGRYHGREAATDCDAARSYDHVQTTDLQTQLAIEFAQQVARDAAPYCFGGSDR